MARRGVEVAAGGRGVAVGGTGVDVGVSVGQAVGVSVGVSVTTGVPVSVGVGVCIGVAVNCGVGVLVAVGVAVGTGEKSDVRGQLEPMVSIMATIAIPRNAPFLDFKSTILFARLRSGWSRGIPFGWQQPTFHSVDYLAHWKVMFVNWPPASQPAKSICTVSDCGIGLASLSTMSIRKVKGAWYMSGAKGANPHSPGFSPTPLVLKVTMLANLRRTVLPLTPSPPMPLTMPLK